MPEFDPSMLPPQPEIVPADLAALTVDNTGSDWSTRVPPASVGMFIAAVARWLSHPRMGTKVTVETLADGWNLSIRLPQPEVRDDIAIQP
jgi:hypothetical protein